MRIGNNERMAASVIICGDYDCMLNFLLMGELQSLLAIPSPSINDPVVV
jgi:hypothetical protein